MAHPLPAGVVKSLFEDFRSDVHSGASEITRKAARCLVAFTEQQINTGQDFLPSLVQLGRAVVNAHPAMASLFNLVNDVFLAVDAPGGDADEAAARAAARAAVERFVQLLDSGLENLATHGQAVLKDDCTVFTHSSSSSVAAILRRGVHQGKKIRAIVSESRPFCEGHELARSLGTQGIATRLVTDAAVGQAVVQADVVIVGADRVAEDVFVNKIGTLPLAMAAHYAGIPVYVACELNKFLPASVMDVFDTPEIVEDPTQEEWMNVQLIHSFYETVPHRWHSGVITEEGLLSRNALSKRFKAFPVSKPLARRPAIPA